MTKRQHLCAILILVLTAFVASSSVVAQETDTKDWTPFDHFTNKHQLGVRIGVWANQGQAPPEAGEDTASNQRFETNINSSSLYLEAYFGYRFMPALMGEISIGIVNRGSVTVVDQFNQSDVGNLNVLPFVLKVKAYPLISTRFKVQPFFMAGGGLFWGRRTVQFTTNQFYYAGLNEDSEVDLNYFLGGGIDVPISSVIALEAQTSFMPIQFDNQLVGATDYDALSITVGIKYLYGK